MNYDDVYEEDTNPSVVKIKKRIRGDDRKRAIAKKRELARRICRKAKSKQKTTW